MADAAQPQSDRELLLKLNGNVEVLAKAIEHFSETLKYLDEKKLSAFDDRLVLVENWKLQIAAGWKLMVVLWTIASGVGIIAGIKYFFK